MKGNELEEIIEKIQNKYSTTKEEIENIIEYNSYIEPQKEEEVRNSLIIKSLKIKGIIEAKKPVNKTFEFFPGVNVISTYGNNLRGKTTVLDIIKYTLTGNQEALPNFIKGNINEYKLSLEINDKKYLFCFDWGKKIFYIEDAEKNEKIEETELKNAADILGKFFAIKFNYYSLKSYKINKKTLDLIESELSWKSYFSSLYLAAKKYNFLITDNNYSGLKSKILQVLFNFKYNKYLNEIKNKAEKLENSILQHKRLIEYKNNYIDESMDNLLKMQEKNDGKINNKKEKIKNIINFDYDNLFEKKKEFGEISEKENELKEKFLKLKKIISKLEKRLIDFKENKIMLKYFPIDPVCPICLKEIKDTKKKNAVLRNKCYICGEPHEYIVDEAKQNEELEKIKNSIDEKKYEAQFCDTELNEIGNKIKIIRNEIRKLENEKEKNKIILEDETNELKDLEFIACELKTKISLLKLLEELDDENRMIYEKKILDSFYNELNEYIKKSNKNKLDNFITKFYDEAKKIGVDSLEEINFKDSLDPVFIKDNKEEIFEKLSSGEQLRIKISFYLTWLQLTLEEEEVIHPAFLMIDSPGKEETNDKDLEELSSIFYELDKKGGKFQIIIASAKDLDDATSPHKIKKYNGYLF